LFIPSHSGGSGLGLANFLFLPFIIVGGIVFGSILLLISERRDWSSASWLASRGAICGALYAALVMFAFGAIMPLSLVYVAASGIAGATSGYLWCRLVEQQDV
jgi:ABC-type xylose transport system permease subunit